MKTIVMAWGNPLRGDDGVALRVAALLPRSLHEIADVIAVPQLQPELADMLRSADRVIFVDASRDGAPGDVRSLPVAPRAGDASLTHDLAPSTLLALAATLYDAHPEAVQITVCGERFDLHEGLSPAVEAAVATAIAEILAAICQSDRV